MSVFEQIIHFNRGPHKITTQAAGCRPLLYVNVDVLEIRYFKFKFVGV